MSDPVPAGLRVACLGFRGSKAHYFQRLQAWELTPTELNARPATLRRWALERPAGAAFVPRVDEGVLAAGFRGPAAEAAWETSLAWATTLGADTLLLRTPATFRPTPANKAALRGFFAGRPGPRVAWWADGLWAGALEDTCALAAEAGLVPVVDPLNLDEDEAPPPGDLVYWRLRGGQGMQGRLSDYDLDRLVGWAAERASGYVVFGAPEMWGDAGRFSGLLRAERAALLGGAGFEDDEGFEDDGGFEDDEGDGGFGDDEDFEDDDGDDVSDADDGWDDSDPGDDGAAG